MGLSQERQFQNYYRVFNRAKWSSRSLSRILLHLLLRAFVPADHPVVLGLDDHIVRRRDAKIAAKGIYRDAVASSKSFMVGEGDSTHHASVVGAVLARNIVGASDPRGPGIGGASSGLVSETAADLLGHLGLGSAAALASQYFLDVRCEG